MTATKATVDHVMYGVADLDEATADFEQLGLPVTGGGAHPDGTRNRTVDCIDGSYVELLAVDTPTSPEARWIRDQITAGTRLLGWGIEVDDIDTVAARLGVPAVPGSIELPDGRIGSWQIVGVDESMADPWLPFFIRYDRPDGTPRPPRAVAGAPDAIAWVELSGDDRRLEAWLGDTTVPVRVVPGAPRLRAVALRVGGADLVLR